MFNNRRSSESESVWGGAKQKGRSPRHKKQRKEKTANAPTNNNTHSTPLGHKIEVTEVGNSQVKNQGIQPMLEALKEKHNEILSMVNNAEGPIGDITAHDGETSKDIEKLLTKKPSDVVNEIATFLTSNVQSPSPALLDVKMSDVFTNTTILRRAWEEKFMHEAHGQERACVNSVNHTCMASQITWNGIKDKNFALTEFYTEIEYTAIEKRGWVWPEERKQCILCLRASIFSQYINTKCNNSGMHCTSTYASIGNIVGEEGEYCVEDVFCSSPGKYEGVFIPIVIPSIRELKVFRVAGVRHLEQQLASPEKHNPSFFF